MADFSSDKLVTLSNLQTYTNALKTDIDNSTIVHKSDTAAAAGEYPVCVLDGIELKPLGITWSKESAKYTMMVGSPWVIKNSISDMVQFDALQIRFETFVNFRSSVYLTAGFITDVVSSDTAITNKKYVDEKSASALSEGKAYTDEKIALNQCLYVDGDGYVCVDYDKLPIINS